MRKNQQGFAIVESVVAFVIVLLFAFASWHFWQVGHKTTKKNSQTASMPVLTTPATAPSKNEAPLKQPTSSQQPSSSTSSATTQASSQTQVQTAVPAGSGSSSPSSSPKAASVSELYRIAADGGSAQESPVTTTLSNVSSVNVTINLQCLGTCNFKLVSDTYSVADTATYTNSQTITYTISTPGSYVFYNQYTPDTKFKIAF